MVPDNFMAMFIFSYLFLVALFIASVLWASLRMREMKAIVLAEMEDRLQEYIKQNGNGNTGYSFEVKDEQRDTRTGDTRLRQSIRCQKWSLTKRLQLIKKTRKKQIDSLLRAEQRNEHKRLVHEHRQVFRIMDIMVIIMVMMNFGAVALTNLMLVERNPEVIEHLAEANVVQAQVHGYEEHPQASSMMFAFVFQSLIWVFLLFCYIYYRHRIHTETQMGIMVAFVCFYFIIIGRDFWNNFGYWLGKIITGGRI